MVREPPVSGDPVGAAKRARCERAGALRLLGNDSSAAGDAAAAAAARPAAQDTQLIECQVGRRVCTQGSRRHNIMHLMFAHFSRKCQTRSSALCGALHPFRVVPLLRLQETK